MALKVHWRKSFDPQQRRGVTQCGEPFHVHPQIVGTGLVVDGEYESTRRIGGLRAVSELNFGMAASKRHGRACSKCKRIWMADA